MEKYSKNWMDWRWQMKSAIKNYDDLPSQIKSQLDYKTTNDVCSLFPMSITPYYLSLAKSTDLDDPILKMSLPSEREFEKSHWNMADPICEENHALFPGFLTRYPDRALFLVSGNCPVFCRHCTRRVMGNGKIVPVTKQNFEAGIKHIEENATIKDVIISGGDPLLLEDDALGGILDRISTINHIDIIRIATRVPVTLPMRVTKNLISKLDSDKTVFVQTHFNHPLELTDQAVNAVSKFVDAGILVNNQSVLLKGVNDTPKEMENLCRGLLKSRIRPYYLFMCDLVEGTSHFWVPLKKAISILASLRGNLSGLAIPQLIVDLPGGHGKIPIYPDYIQKAEDDNYVLRAPNGTLVKYPK